MPRAKKPPLRWESVCGCGHVLAEHSNEPPGSWAPGPRTPRDASIQRCQHANEEGTYCSCRRFVAAAPAAAENDDAEGAARGAA